MIPFDEDAGRLLDELLRIHGIYGRHRAACDLSTALAAARAEGAEQQRAADVRALREMALVDMARSAASALEALLLTRSAPAADAPKPTPKRGGSRRG